MRLRVRSGHFIPDGLAGHGSGHCPSATVAWPAGAAGPSCGFQLSSAQTPSTLLGGHHGPHLFAATALIPVCPACASPSLCGFPCLPWPEA